MAGAHQNKASTLQLAPTRKNNPTPQNVSQLVEINYLARHYLNEVVRERPNL
jgi:hypothetical protein